MTFVRSVYRRANVVLYRTRCRLNRLHFRLLGNCVIHKDAIIEPRARLQITAATSVVALEVGRGSIVKNDAYLLPRDGKISIGAKCSINPFCILIGYGGIVIGDNVRIAAHTSIIAFNHEFSDINQSILRQGNVSRGIKIEDDVWVGTGVRILDGVTVGRGAVIGAGSVVTKDVPPFAVMAGVPARKIKERGDGLTSHSDL
jgi:acetyltransferase-like isoleucine patch superfamily enzyme